MKINDKINFQNVEELSLALRAGKVSRERFSLEISTEDAYKALYAAVKADVEHRGLSEGKTFRTDSAVEGQLLKTAQWLNGTNPKRNLLLCGLCGNGKTTFARALANLIAYTSEKALGYSERKTVRFYKAKDICSACVTDRSEYERIFREEMIIIDDLGEEPREMIHYGMVYTPIVDLVSERYDKQLMTIATTNLNVDELKVKYGARIYDRFKEMFATVVFQNSSFR